MFYKFVETDEVTAEKLETIVNEWVAQGWQFDQIQFITPGSHSRPTMAFVVFVMPPFEEFNSEDGFESSSN